MLDGVLSLIPGAKVSAVGVVRNEETLQAQTYLEKLAPDMHSRLALIIDPMLATGNSMVATIDLLKKPVAGKSARWCWWPRRKGWTWCARTTRT